MGRWARLDQPAEPWEPAFELLEDRLLFAAQPVATVSGGGEALVGETAHVTVTFDNVPDGSPGSNTGFSPYVDLILPTNGADGSGPGNAPVNDGVTFQSATYLGQSVQSTSIEFDVNGEAIHPFARDASGELRVVHASDYGAQPGDTLVALQLPFGSFAPDQPAAAIDVSLGVSNLADLNTPLSVSAVGGFAFGRDALNNPTVDNPVVGASSSVSINPTLFTITKTSNLPESETATGPSYPHQWTVTLDIATGQTIDNLVLQDQVPDGVIISAASAPGATVQIDPATNEVVAAFGSPVTGGAGAADVTMTINFYVGEFLSPGDPTVPVLDPATGAPRTLENNVSASAEWTPIDTRDETQSFVVDPAGPENVIVAKALAIQKTATVVGGGPATPGDTIEWTIRAQVSDYFDLDNLTVNDLLSDGQTFDTTFAPTLTVTEQGGLPDSFGAFSLANFTVLRPAATTSATFRVGDEMETRGADSILQGGGGVTPAPTEIVITFRTTVDSNYSTGEPVLHNDVVTNALTGQAQNIAPGGGIIADNSNAEVPLAPGNLDGKTIYAINGVLVDPNAPPPLVTDGDIVTFRLQYTVPSQSADSLVLTDFLPLPIFAATPIVFQNTQSGVAPPVNQAWFGPTDTLDAVMPSSATYPDVPTVVIDAASNSVAFQYGSFTLPLAAGTRQIDILFTVEVADEPFGDGLRFNNLVQATEVNSAGEISGQVDTGEVILSQPELTLQKGIVASTNADTIFAPVPAAPVPFSAPGSTGVRFSGPINSNVLANSDINSDVSQVDAGDIVTFAIIVENTGSGRNGAFDVLISDVLPPGFEIPPGGLNLSVTDGAGNAIAFTGDLFGGE